MRAARLTGVRKVSLDDVPEPELRGDTDVLLRVTTVGVCGSDVHYYATGRIGTQVVEFPYAVGHESAADKEQPPWLSGFDMIQLGTRVMTAAQRLRQDPDKARRYE